MAQKSVVSTYLEAGALVSFGGLLRALPLSVSARVGEVIARVFGKVSYRPQSFVEAQMRATFGARFDDKQYTQMSAGFFRHIGCLLAEGVRLKTLTPESVEKYVCWSDELFELLDPLKDSNLGTFMTTGHIGNWEFTGAACAIRGLLVASIARPLDNPVIDRIVESYREFSGQKIWVKQGALTNMLRAVKKGQSVGILVDQDAGEAGLQIPFLGRASSTVPAVADLSMRTGAPVFPGAIQRVGNKPMQFRANFRELIFPDSKADATEERLRILTAMNESLSSIIMDAPEQWLWTHRRWKTPNPFGAGK